MIDAQALAASLRLGRLERLSLPAGRALAALALVIAAVQGWAYAADTLSAPMPREIDLPAVPGWTRADYNPRIWWEPRAEGAEHRLLGRYRDAQGRQVDVFVALYSRQGEGHEAGGFGQGALTPDSAWAWQAPGPAIDNGKGERLLGGGTDRRLAVTWYRNGTLLSGSNARLKLAVIANHLSFRARPTAMLILSSDDPGNGAAEDAIRRFRASTGPLGAWMDRVTRVR